MKGLRKALLIGMTLGVTMLGTIGCMNQDSASSNDVLKVGADARAKSSFQPLCSAGGALRH
ncbi:MAG: hypothetical protein E6604_03520 [Veillonella sp.]|nr:hypothetical protein [Veillonella sp.]